jgi:hypothetical protein
MLPIRRMPIVIVTFLVLAFLPLTARTEDPLPSRLSDKVFWKLVSDLSEPDGAFISDNFVSNERSFQHVLPDLARDQRPASAYIGVGPEQNFTYILAMKPQIAFIVDIRRQNLVVHLMYKALFELSADRAEFLSRLFSRARPENLTGADSIHVLLRTFSGLPADAQIFQDNLKAIKQRLTVDHGFALTMEDEAALEKILGVFGHAANNLTYNGPGAPGGLLPTFAEMMQATDKEGVPRSFLATEAGFLALKEFQARNLVVPVVGDFAGPHALRSVGQYLRAHGATVTSFYTSNVEQYLFLNRVLADGFYANVSTLPLTAKSVFIRGLILGPNGEYSPSPAFTRFSRFETELFSIPDLVKRFAAGTIEKYDDIVSGVTVR